MATHDRKPRSPSGVHPDAAIQHAQEQYMRQIEVQIKTIKENNGEKGERRRGGVRRELEKWNGQETGCPSLQFFPPGDALFKFLLLSRSASHALHTHPHVPLCPPKYLVMTKHCCLLLYMKKHVVCSLL